MNMKEFFAKESFLDAPLISTVSLKQKSLVDKLVLYMAPVILLMGLLVSWLADPEDLVYTTAWHTLLVQVLAIYLPVSLYMRLSGGRATFGMRRISAFEAVLCFILGIAYSSFSDALTSLLYLLYKALGIDPLLSTLVPRTGGGWRVAALALLGVVLPAYTDELFFRGLVLHAWQARGKRRAILHAACLSALFAFSPGALPVTLLTGLLFGMLVVQTGSCYASISAHIGMGAISLYSLCTLSADGIADTATYFPANAWELAAPLLLSLFVGALVCFSALRALGRIRRIREQAAEQGGFPEKKFRFFDAFEKTPELAHLQEMLKRLEDDTLFPAGKRGKRPYASGKSVVTATYLLLIGVNIYLVCSYFIA